MGDSKILTKFRRLCDDYKAEYVIEGVVEDFDTIYPVPPERLTRGMTIKIGEETRFVDFHFTKRPPVSVGDRVLVVGREYSTVRNSILPVVILSPTEKWVLFSEEHILKNPDKLELAIYLAGMGVCIAVYLLAREVHPLLAFGALVFSYLLICTPSSIIQSYRRRARLYNCGEEECHLLLEEMGGRFAPRVKATERQTRRTF